MFTLDSKAQHTILLVLSLLALFMSIYLVSKGKSNSENFRMMKGRRYADKGFPYPLVSTMTPRTVAQRLNNPQCAAAVNNYCPLANQTQSVLGGQSLSGQLQDVVNACGNQFPVNGACAAVNPSFGLNVAQIQGGTATANVKAACC